MNASEPKVHIIGVGGDGLAGLTARARDLLLSAEVVMTLWRDFTPGRHRDRDGMATG